MTQRKGMGLGKGTGYKNIIPNKDSSVHSQSAQGIKQPQCVNMISPEIKINYRGEENMTLAQAEIIRGVVEKELTKILDEEDKSRKDLTGHDWKVDRMFNVHVITNTDPDKKRYGVRVATDSDVYDLFYEQYNNDNSFKLQERVVKAVEKVMGKRYANEHHYFEHYGGGFIDLY